MRDGRQLFPCKRFTFMVAYTTTEAVKRRVEQWSGVQVTSDAKNMELQQLL